jgi:hypothetical protein
MLTKRRCGGGCGKCYNLTSTGSAPCSTCGTAEPAGNSIIVMVTNLCPNNGNEQWCPTVGGTNQYGYSYHFDIMAQSEVFGDNPVVEFEPVACPGQAATDWQTCVCFGQTASDETPVGISAGSPSSVAQPVVAPSSVAQPVVALSSSLNPPAGGDLTSSTETPAADPTISSDPKVPSTLSTVIGSSTSAAEQGSPSEGPGKHRPHEQHDNQQQPPSNACRA